jgi:hypothetical protein
MREITYARAASLAEERQESVMTRSDHDSQPAHIPEDSPQSPVALSPCGFACCSSNCERVRAFYCNRIRVPADRPTGRDPKVKSIAAYV